MAAPYSVARGFKPLRVSSRDVNGSLFMKNRIWNIVTSCRSSRFRRRLKDRSARRKQFVEQQSVLHVGPVPVHHHQLQPGAGTCQTSQEPLRFPPSTLGEPRHAVTGRNFTFLCCGSGGRRVAPGFARLDWHPDMTPVRGT